MLRVSTTTLESFRRVLQSEYAVEQELIDQIAGKPFEPTWQMRAGSTWQAALCGEYSTREFWFDSKMLGEARAYVGSGLCEVKSTKILDVHGSPVALVAQVDHVRGLALQENKAKFGTPDARDYEPSLQWRAYLLVHDAASVQYNLWNFKDPKCGYCELRSVDSFRFWRYAELEADCRRWLRAFLDWANARKLTPYLDRETPALEAA